MALENTSRLSELKLVLKISGSRKKAKVLQSFFKTGPGEYAEGDVFLGISVPVLRGLAKEYGDIPIKDTLRLLKSGIHEERLLALLILIIKYGRSSQPVKKKIYGAYLANTRHINNWDLVDVTAKHIVGHYLFNRKRSRLYRLARSGSLWERRIAVLSTFYFIGKKDYGDALKIAEMLLSDAHDLIHKAVGWMLREIGKGDIDTELEFIDRHYRSMSRTTLRYAIERFPEEKRLYYLRKR